MPTPNSADLLLALGVRDLAIKRRTHEIMMASNSSPGERAYTMTEKAWPHDIDFYVKDVTVELIGLWSTIHSTLEDG